MKQIHFGADYYPEHWPRERWETDAKLMEQMGIQVVRMGEFSWHKMEPEDGIFDFTWLDEAVELLGTHGIVTILGTPTAAPPAWMVQKNPEILPVDREGHRKNFGGRHHDCHSNSIYRGYVKRLVTNMAEHYRENPYVIGWQPDNELGNSHGDLCTCNSCRDAFARWLEQKYQSVEALNDAWGTAFWSQEYNDFSQIVTPRTTATGVNPSAMLDWKRFHSDLIIDFFREQSNIIRNVCPKHFITHNYMGFADTVDYYDLGKELDFVSHDQYPGGFYMENSREEPYVSAATLDVVRSYKNQTFWIMEQQSGPTGWEILGRTPAPGQLSAWALQAVGHGADAVVFFRWRSCAIGTEQYWHGILPHSGVPGRRYQEFSQLTHSMEPLLEQIQGAMPASKVGIVFSFSQGYAFEIQPHHPELSYQKQLLKYYREFYRLNIPVDFVPETGDFSKYQLLVAPLEYLMTPELEERYFSYVAAGGHLVLTMRTGVKDVQNRCMTEQPLPGRLGELAGVTVADYDCLRNGAVSVSYQGQEEKGMLWSDILQPEQDTQVLAVYTSEFYAGSPCVTRRSYQKGLCYYVGTEPDETWMRQLVSDIAKEAALKGLGETEEGVELSIRENESVQFVFAVNLTSQKKTYSLLDGEKGELVRGDNLGRLNPYEVQIIKIRKGE